MRDMTGEQGGNEDILGFGNTDRTRRSSRLAIRLDRLTLRITRRPRLTAALASLAVMVLAAGAVTYFGPARTASGSSAAQPQPVSGQCAYSSQSKAAAAAIAKFVQQMKAQIGGTSSAYSSTLTIGSITSDGTQFSVTVDPVTGKVTCP
jgi:hypothetical protein